MSKHSDCISLQPLPSALSSHWSLDTLDLKRATNPLLPTKPLRVWFPFKRLRTTTRHSYNVGDPVIHPTTEIGYTFEGWTEPSTFNALGERVRKATFRQVPTHYPPQPDVILPLYHTRTRTPLHPRTSSGKRPGIHLAFGWLKWICCLGDRSACQDTMH